MPMEYIKGIGPVNFPEGMTDEEKREALKMLPQFRSQMQNMIEPPLPEQPAPQAPAVDKFLFGGAGAGAGAAVSGARMTKKGVEGLGRAAEEGRIEAQRREAIRQALSGQAPATTGAAPVRDAIPDSMLQQQQRTPATGYQRGATNYASAFLNPIESQKATSMQHAQELVRAAAEGEKRLQAAFPGQTTELPSGLKVMNERMRSPRESIVFAPGETPEAPMAARQLPERVPPIRQPSGLEKVQQIFEGMMESRPVQAAKSVMGTVGKYAGPPLGGLNIGTNIAEMYGEQQKPPQERSLLRQALSGGSIAAGLAAFFPPTAIPSIITSLGLEGTKMLLDNLQKSREMPLGQSSQEMPVLQ